MKKLGFLILVGFMAFASANEVKAASLPKGITIANLDIAGKSKEEVTKLIEDYVNKNLDRKINLEINGKTFTTSYKELGYKCDNIRDVLDTVDSYGSGNLIKRYKDSVDLEQSPLSLELKGKIDDSLLDEFIKKNSESIGRKAKNATITRENGAFVITDSVDGVSVDEVATKSRIEEALSGTTSDVVDVSALVTVGKAKINRSDLEQIKDVLGTFTTDYSTSSPERATNISVGSEKLNGKLLMPGETLSGYEFMHPFTTENGYRIAHAYENGQVVDSVGGGACQIATTLYNAALRAEVGIAQRQNHSMTVSYVQPSADAAIAGTYKDIKITNNQSTPIYVESYTKGRKLTFTIWGKEERPQNRSVEFVSEVLSQTEAGVTYKDDPTLPAGQVVKESSGHNGRKSKLWKVVKVNGVEEDRKLISTDTYMVSNTIMKRGTGAAAAPTTPNPTPAPAPTQATEQAAPTQGNQNTNPSSNTVVPTNPEPVAPPQGNQNDGVVSPAPEPAGGDSSYSNGGPGA